MRRVKFKTTGAGPGGVFHAGSEADIDEAAAAALIEAGYAEAAQAVTPVPAVAAASIPAARADVVIPDDWRLLSAKELRALADNFSAQPVKTRNEAIAVIETVSASRPPPAGDAGTAQAEVEPAAGEGDGA